MTVEPAKSQGHSYAERIRVQNAKRMARIKAQQERLRLSQFEQAIPSIRMVISEWSKDEFGNKTRTIRAA